VSDDGAAGANDPDGDDGAAGANDPDGDDGAAGANDPDGETPPMEAYRYPDGSITYPGHPIGPGGEEPIDTVDLSEYTAEIVTWTTSTATPPGVREPNALAIVEFDVDGEPVRAIGQLDVGDADPGADESASPGVAIGDAVRPVYAPELREPGAGIREPESQDWDGYRFRPVDE
jgi:hypothetical protein